MMACRNNNSQEPIDLLSLNFYITEARLVVDDNFSMDCLNLGLN